MIFYPIVWTWTLFYKNQYFSISTIYNSSFFFTENKRRIKIHVFYYHLKNISETSNSPFSRTTVGSSANRQLPVGLSRCVSTRPSSVWCVRSVQWFVNRSGFRPVNNPTIFKRVKPVVTRRPPDSGRSRIVRVSRTFCQWCRFGGRHSWVIAHYHHHIAHVLHLSHLAHVHL